MRLKQLKINGFKSFADTTVIEFPSAVSGIVGPNGCGKSNVIDAIRWVLGEARVSELRGSSSMSELIFAGSSNRAASSRASVEMVLDNSDGSVTGAWGRYTELSVKRVITRDGTNAYLINNQQVRRRDVQDIFMGTGLGPRSYAIISQGMISNFIKAKPEELRVYLEEAAGVSKYKERRKETESALTSTQNNLEKVHYLQENKRAEIERLSAQAQVARRWQQLEDERMHAELLWYFLQEQNTAEEVGRINTKIAARELDVLNARGQSQQLIAQIEQLRQAAQTAREAADAARQLAWQANSKVTEIEGNIRHIVQRKDALTRQISQQTEALERRRAEKDDALERIRVLQDAQRSELDKAQALDEEAAAMAEDLEQKSDEHASCRAHYDEARDKAARGESQLAVLEVQLQSLERAYESTEAQLSALKDEAKHTTVPDSERFAQLSAEIDEKRALLEEVSAQAEEIDAQSQQAQERFEQLRAQKDALVQQLERTRARLQALESVQEQAQGEGRLPQWLQKMGLEGLPQLFESLEVDGPWAVALEAILTVKASAVPMGQLKFAAGFDRDPPPARFVLYSQTVGPRRVPEPGGIDLPLLTDVVRSSNAAVQAALAQWLAHVWVADDLTVALSLREQLPAHGRIVTAHGHVVDAVSVSFWAQESQSAGLLSRAAEIKTLSAQSHDQLEQLERVDQTLIAAKQSASDMQQRQRDVSDACGRLRDELHTIEVEHSALQAAISAWQLRSSKMSQQIDELSRRLAQLKAERDECEARFMDMEESISDLHQAAIDAKGVLEEAEAALGDMQERVRECEQQAQMARLAARNSQARQTDAEQQLKSTEDDLQMLAATLEELAAEREELDEDAQRDGLGAVLRERDEKARAHEQAEQASRQAEDALEQARHRQSELNELQTPLLQEISDLKVRRETFITQGATFTERLDACEADRKQLALEVSADALKAPTLKARVTRLAEQIAELGPVNHAALENLQLSQKAMEETERQVEDLQEAIANLLATIRRIDAETRALLKSTFEAVNRNFSEMFTGLFAGGTAQLKMTGDEILDSGVEVIAQPPGKRNASVKLLSGGEQAMTATALVFAIFRLNPAPFCLLDEVDAPLDEANQDRLARRIIEMSEQTQFMMITHHRVTMEHIGRLVGVTMKEPGVSRVVAVDVRAAVDLAQQSV